MIINNTFLSRWEEIQYPNILIYGPNKEYLTNYFDLSKFNIINNKFYKNESIYIFNIEKYKEKKKLLDDITKIIKTINHFGEDNKKTIIILHIDKLSNIYQHSLKEIITKSYLTTVFLVYSINLYSVDLSLRGVLLNMSLPIYERGDSTIDITYKKIIKLLKRPIKKTTIENIRELSYYYYIAHKDSNSLQRYIVMMIGQNSYLPNKIKMNIVKDIAELNHQYQHSYRKPIFLEAIIMCLFKHLENYTTNL